MKPNFDTHEFIKTLETAGVPIAQAEAFSNAVVKAQSGLDDNTATKSDIKDLSWQIKGLYALYAIQMAWLGWMTAILLELVKK